MAYLSIPALSVYLLVEQETAAVKAFRRTGQRLCPGGLPGTPEIGVELPLAQIYASIKLGPEPEQVENGQGRSGPNR